MYLIEIQSRFSQYWPKMIEYLYTDQAWCLFGRFRAVSCENNQLVSSSKFKLVCQVVNAKKPKKSRVTHLQLKGVIELYYWHEKTQTLSFKTSYLCWIIVSYYTKVHCLQKNIMCLLIIKISAFHCALWSTPENLLVHCYCSVVQIRADQSEALKPYPL